MKTLFETEKKQNLIFDVGLHKGEDTDFYLKKGFSVVAFEADPDLVAECQERFREQLESGQLTIVAGAIVPQEMIDAGQDSVTFYKNADVSVWGTISPNWAKRNTVHQTSSCEISVPTIDFVDVLQTYGIPRYLKADIEGADMICIEALKRFKHKPDYVSIESSKTSLKELDNELTVLDSLGYTHFKAVEQSELHTVQSVPREAAEGKNTEHVFPDGSSGLFGRELPGTWMNLSGIRRRYRYINLGYYLVSERGILPKRYFPGKWKLRGLICRVLKSFTKGAVPGWYDTHAKHKDAVE